MSAHRVINWAMAVVICLAMGSLYRLDGPSDIEALGDVAADVQDAPISAARELRLARADRGQP